MRRPRWPTFDPAYKDRRLIVVFAVVSGAGLVAVSIFTGLALDKVNAVTKSNHATQCTVIANTRYTPDDLKRIEKAAVCPQTKPLPRVPSVIISVGPKGTVTITPKPTSQSEPLPPEDLVTETVPEPQPTAYVTTPPVYIHVPGPTVTVTTTKVVASPTLPPGAICAPVICTSP